MLAGSYLSGNLDAISVHSIIGGTLTPISFVALVLAGLHWWPGRGPAWPALVMAVLVVLIVVQAFDTFNDARTDIIVPAQTVFGPVAFVAYLWMKRHYGRERTMEEFLASSDVVLPASVEPAQPQATAPQSEPARPELTPRAR